MRNVPALFMLGLSLALTGCPSATPPPPPPPPPPPDPVDPEPVDETPSTAIVEIATFSEHHCVRRKNGSVACWGKNTYGQVGSGERGDEPLELTEVASVSGARAIAVGRDFSCALVGNRAMCWGNNEDGQLGDGRGVEPGALSLTPVEVGGSDIAQIALGEYHGCAADSSSKVQCWGNSANGQAGFTEERAKSTLTAIKAGRVQMMSAGASHNCALMKSKGHVMCWGRHSEGQLGADVAGSRAKPQRVQGLSDVKLLASGHLHACAMDDEGTLSCWGDNKSEQLGPKASGKKRSKEPIEIEGLEDVVELAGGGAHTCARIRSGEVMCWGSNDKGQLGSGASGESSATPIEVPELKGATQLALGIDHTCAVRLDKAVCIGAVEATIE